MSDLDDYYAYIMKYAQPFPLPPDGFNPMTAPDKQLEAFGLPARPDPKTQPELFMFWGLLVSGAKPIIPEFPNARNKVAPPWAFSRIGPGKDGRGAAPYRSGFRHHEKSRNWSGAYITPNRAKRFWLVVGGWTVPTPAVPAVPPGGDLFDPGDFRSSTWIGLDGHRSYPNSSMPQIGTSQHVKLVGGVPTIDTMAWWQWWVNGRPVHHTPVPIVNFPVRPGDEMLASVSVTATGDALFLLKNQRTGLLAPFIVIRPANVEPLGSTAEWIHERPSEPGTPLMYPLPHCTDVNFRFCLALSGAGYALPMTLQRLDANARLVRMFETFEGPRRVAYVSQAEKKSATRVRVFYREAGA